MRLNLKSKRTWKKILSVVLGVGLAFGSVIGITNLVLKIEEDTLKTVRPIYHQGELDSSTGEYLESKAKIYSDIFECKGLTITPKFENDVSYRVFYYDTNENFLTCTSKIDSFYQSDLDFPRYARIEITSDKDIKINWYEVSKYARQLKIEVSKEQNSLNFNNLQNVGDDTNKFSVAGFTKLMIADNNSNSAVKFYNASNEEIQNSSITLENNDSVKTETISSSLNIYTLLLDIPADCAVIEIINTAANSNYWVLAK